MNLVVLVVMVCLVAQPENCSERRLTFESHGSLDRCMWEAQPYLAQWIGAHPEWTIMRYRCAWPDQVDEKS
jgi:hypothetical protein